MIQTLDRVRLGWSSRLVPGTLALIGLLGSATLSMPSACATDSDWAEFRGPGLAGTAQTGPLPAELTESNKLWSTPLPGPGSSSPILVGKKVFLTCWSGYGTSTDAPGDPNALRRHLVCLDRETGKILWKSSVQTDAAELPYGGMLAQHGYASQTPVSDGEQVYAYFGKAGLAAYDLDGNEQWRIVFGTANDPRRWGSASSPVVVGDRVIVNAGAEAGALVAVNKKTGEVEWESPAEKLNSTWATPVVVTPESGEPEVVLPVTGEVWGLNPENGKLRWLARTDTGRNTSSSCFVKDGLIYTHQGSTLYAIRPGGTGDVTESHIVWQARSGQGGIPTDVIADGRIYAAGGGVLTVHDAKSGEQLAQSRLRIASAASASAAGGGGRGGRGGGAGGGADYASPVAGDGKLYLTSRAGVITVLKLGTEGEVLASNDLSDGGDWSATPALADGMIVVRSSKAISAYKAK